MVSRARRRDAYSEISACSLAGTVGRIVVVMRNYYVRTVQQFDSLLPVLAEAFCDTQRRSNHPQRAYNPASSSSSLLTFARPPA